MMPNRIANRMGGPMGDGVRTRCDFDAPVARSPYPYPLFGLRAVVRVEIKSSFIVTFRNARVGNGA